jgi:hypothetical protein
MQKLCDRGLLQTLRPPAANMLRPKFEELMETYRRRGKLATIGQWDGCDSTTAALPGSDD